MSTFQSSARRWFAAASAVLSLTAASAVQAAYPEHPVTIVVPCNTGTTPDLVSRLLAAEMAKQTGGNFVVQNRTGASGIIGTQAVANAAPDGYTIGFANVATLAINQSLYAKLQYDADKQLAPVALTGSVQNLLAVRPGLNIKSVAELIAMAKKDPGKLVVASGGNGTTGHIAGAMLVFIPAIGEFVIPSLLGGPGTQMIGRILWDEFFSKTNWPRAAALAMIMLVVVVIPIMLMQRAQNAVVEGRR